MRKQWAPRLRAARHKPWCNCADVMHTLAESSGANIELTTGAFDPGVCCNSLRRLFAIDVSSDTIAV
jgi:hypothetical protein